MRVRLNAGLPFAAFAICCGEANCVEDPRQRVLDAHIGARRKEDAYSRLAPALNREVDGGVAGHVPAIWRVPVLEGKRKERCEILVVQALAGAPYAHCDAPSLCSGIHDLDNTAVEVWSSDEPLQLVHGSQLPANLGRRQVVSKYMYSASLRW
eukprot:scaffold23105_cov79-Phaeocystis_antarctica.AAC.4